MHVQTLSKNEKFTENIYCLWLFSKAQQRCVKVAPKNLTNNTSFLTTFMRGGTFLLAPIHLL